MASLYTKKLLFASVKKTPIGPENSLFSDIQSVDHYIYFLRI